MKNRNRHLAREAALSVLYYAEVGQTPAPQAFEAYFAEHQPDALEEVSAFSYELVMGTVAETATLDALIGQHSTNWRVERLAVLDRLILRMAIWELQHDREQAPAVVINEALELARRFSGDESVPFVNGILDAVSKTLSGPRA